MKIVVIGATGTIGNAVADTLAQRHEVVRASRSSEVSVDVNDPASLAALFEKVKDVDALVSCGGDVQEMQKTMGPFDKLSDEQFQFGFHRMLAQFQLIRLCLQALRDGGSITLTTGLLSTYPRPGSAVASMMGSGLESLVRSAALEMPRGIRINAISPGFVKETMEKWGMDSASGMPAQTLAGFYASAVEGTLTGVIIDPTRS